MQRPEDVSLEAWTRAMVVDAVAPDERRLAIARSVMAAEARERELIINAVKAQKYLPSQGIDAEMAAFNDGIDECVGIILKRGCPNA